MISLKETELILNIGSNKLLHLNHPCSVCSSDDLSNWFVHFHASDLAYCGKQVQLRILDYLNGKRKHTDLNKANFFNDGHIHEEEIRKYLKNGLTEEYTIIANREFVTEVITNGEKLIVYGHPDIIVKNRITKEITLFECKALMDGTYKRSINTGEYREEYYGQVQCYLWQLDLPSGMLVIKNRNTGAIDKIHHIDVNPQWVEDRLYNLSMIQKSIKNGDTDSIIKKYDLYNRMCNFCEYNNICWK